MVNSEIYAALVRRAKKMAGVPFPLSHIDGEFESPQILSRVSSLFVRSAATKFMCGFVLFAVIATLVILAISQGEPKSLNNGAYAICVGAIGGFYLMLASMRDFNIPRKLRRILQSKAMNTESR
jgi:hypothetical protein